MVPSQEPSKDLSHGGLPHEQGRPEGTEDKALQDLRDPLGEGIEDESDLVLP